MSRVSEDIPELPECFNKLTREDLAVVSAMLLSVGLMSFNRAMAAQLAESFPWLNSSSLPVPPPAQLMADLTKFYVTICDMAKEPIDEEFSRMKREYAALMGIPESRLG